MSRAVAPHWGTKVDKAMQRHNPADRKQELRDPVICVRCKTKIERRDSFVEETDIVCRHPHICEDRQRLAAFYKRIGSNADGSPMDE